MILICFVNYAKASDIVFYYGTGVTSVGFAANNIKVTKRSKKITIDIIRYGLNHGNPTDVAKIFNFKVFNNGEYRTIAADRFFRRYPNTIYSILELKLTINGRAINNEQEADVYLAQGYSLLSEYCRNYWFGISSKVDGELYIPPFRHMAYAINIKDNTGVNYCVYTKGSNKFKISQGNCSQYQNEFVHYSEAAKKRLVGGAIASGLLATGGAAGGYYALQGNNQTGVENAISNNGTEFIDHFNDSIMTNQIIDSNKTEFQMLHEWENNTTAATHSTPSTVRNIKTTTETPKTTLPIISTIYQSANIGADQYYQSPAMNQYSQQKEKEFAFVVLPQLQQNNITGAPTRIIWGYSKSSGCSLPNTSFNIELKDTQGRSHKVNLVAVKADCDGGCSMNSAVKCTTPTDYSLKISSGDNPDLPPGVYTGKLIVTMQDYPQSSLEYRTNLNIDITYFNV